MQNIKKILLLISLSASAALLTACGGGSTSTPAPTVAADYPTSLVAQAGISQVVLNWTGVEGASYKVYYSTTSLADKASTTALHTAAGITSATFNDTQTVIVNLINDTPYYFRVTALKAGVESVPSAEVSATPTFPVPANLQASAGTSQVVLNWTGVEGASYKVYYSTTSLADKASTTALHTAVGITSATLNDTQTVIPNLINDTPYYFRVTALKAGVESVPSAEVSATPTFPVPANLQASAGTSQVVLNWTSIEGTTYKVYYSTTSLADSTSAAALHTAVGITSATFNDNKTVIANLINDTRYYFRVTALKAGLESVPSAEVSATPVFLAPTGLVAQSHDTQVRLDWDAVASADHYKVYYSTSSLAGITTLAELHEVANLSSETVSKDYPEKQVKDLSNDIPYHFIVTAVKGSEESLPSVPVTSIPKRQPTTIIEANASYQAVFLQWNPVAKGYIVHYATESFAGKAISEYGNLAGHSSIELGVSNLYIPGLENGTTYYFVVTLFENGIESLPSAEKSATPALSAPDNVTLNPNSGQVTLTWTAKTGATRYHIYYATESFGEITDLANNYNTVPGGTKIVSTDTNSYIEHTITGLTDGIPYYFLVTSVNDTEESAPSTELSATPSFTAITEHTAAVNAVAFSPDGSRILSGSSDHSVRLWNSTNGAAISTLTGHTDVVHAVAFNSSGTRIVSGGGNSSVHLWNTTSGVQITSLTVNSAFAVISVVFSSSGTHIISGRDDNLVHIWNVDGSNSTLAHTLETPHENTRENSSYAALNPAAPEVLVTDGVGNVRLWNTTSGKQIGNVVNLSNNRVDRIAFSPSGDRFAAIIEDSKDIYIYNSADYALVQTLNATGVDSGFPKAVVFSPDGSKLISGDSNRNVRIWDALAGGASLETLTGHTNVVRSVAISKDGKRIASGSDDKTIRLWEPTSLKDTAQ